MKKLILNVYLLRAGGRAGGKKGLYEDMATIANRVVVEYVSNNMPAAVVGSFPLSLFV